MIKELKKRHEENGTDFVFNLAQVRYKFQRYFGECKKATLTLNSASGMKFFRKTGSWKSGVIIKWYIAKFFIFMKQ